MQYCKTILLPSFIWLLLLPSGFFAQSTLGGFVYDDLSGEALIGANVVVKGTTEGTVTDWDGSFEFATTSSFPLTIVISYVGYVNKEVQVEQPDDKLKFQLTEAGILIEGIEVRGQRISDKQKSSPLTVESLDLIAIKETASASFYDGLGSLKDVDLTTASLGFTIVNTRGFNSTSPVRSLQIIDGVDNQSPGLNFSLGNFLGASELDINKVDLIVGASSAFYGPNAFNGVISMETKNPFLHQGLAAGVKGGERSLLEAGFRWADAFKNKNGLPVFAYKLTGFMLRANDWEANNYNPVNESRVDVSNPGGYDAVNIYGDEFQTLNDFSQSLSRPGLGIFYRTGYREEDLVDYNTRNYKASAAFHFRLQPTREIESPELILSSSYGGGTTVYQGDNRYSLKNIQFYQHRLELNKRDKYFFRVYATHEDSGDSFNPYLTALLLQKASKSDLDWKTDYVNYWERNINPIIRGLEGFPRAGDYIGRPEEYRRVLDSFLMPLEDELIEWHGEARESADSDNPFSNKDADFYAPGTERFEEKFKEITSKIAFSEGGTKFYDKSALVHAHGEYWFKNIINRGGWFNNLDWVLGANARQYLPDSKGSILLDTFGRKIETYEYGMYTGATSTLLGNTTKLNFSLRYDKHENFDGVFSPAASLVYNPSSNNYFRLSFSSAIRNPTLTDQYLFFQVGRATLLGNIDGYEDLITLESFIDYLDGGRDVSKIQRIDVPSIQPEKVKTIELGARTTLFDALYLDLGYYYSFYKDFIGYNILVKSDFDPILGFPINTEVFRISANAVDEVTTQGFSAGANYYFGIYYSLSGNFSWNVLNTQTDDPIVPAFNTPEYKYNISLSGRDMILNIGSWRLSNFGFKVNYKWIDSFIFEGSPEFTGIIPSYDILDAQINWRWARQNTTFKLGASNVLGDQNYQTFGGPTVGRLAYFSIVYDWKKKI